jgi:hypothetical protein
MQLSYEISLLKAHANVQPYVILGTTPSAMITKRMYLFLTYGHIIFGWPFLLDHSDGW